MKINREKMDDNKTKRQRENSTAMAGTDNRSLPPSKKPKAKKQNKTFQPGQPC